MATKSIQMPELGEGVSEGELVTWSVKIGDTITADQTIAEMMTDKATVEVPSPSAGVVKELKFKEGDVVTVGSVMIVIETDGAAAGASAAKTAPTPAVPAASAAKAAPAAGAAAVAAKPASAANGSAANGSGGATKSVVLPELGEGVAEGELVNWLVKIGDKVTPDQIIAEVMTDKATVEIPTPAGGTVKEIKFKEGDVVTVGSVMIVLDGATNGAASVAAPTASASTATTAAPRAPAAAHAPAAAMSASASASAGGMDVYPPAAGNRVLATPATRRLAREMGVDINQMRGTGVAGRVTREDVQKTTGASVGASGAGATSAGRPQVAPSVGGAIPRPAYQGPAGAAEERVALKGIRKKIAENMQLYKQIVPHFTLMDEADVTALVKVREDMKAMAEKAGIKVTYLPFVMKAMLATMREFPMFNASIDDAAQEIVYKKYFNIGFAADTPQGLLVPVIKDADQKTIGQISKEIVDLSNRARDGKLKIEEMKGATITITNIGSVAGLYATPIINHPEVAILGMYKMSDKPVIRNGELAVIKSMNFTITCDHRLIDGAVAARFMKAFIQRLENPGALMLDMM